MKLSLLLTIVLNCLTSFCISYSHELCILTRVKDISFILPQWLEFHQISGVNHIYIANDCSSGKDGTIYWSQFYQKLKFTTVFLNQSFNDCTGEHRPKESLLFNYMFQKAKNSCKWITVIDPDEYMVSIDNAENDLHQTIVNSQLPIIRMSWDVMSTHGHESHQTGLLLDIYQDGKLGRNLKTLIQSKYVAAWTDSHHPFKFNWFSPNVGGMPLRDYSRPFFIQDYELKNDSSGCEVPKAGIILKHFQGLSWEDYQQIRASRKYDSAGLPNAWADQARLHWESFNITRNKCSRLAEACTKHVAVKMKQTIREKLGKFCGNEAEKINKHYNAWVSGDVP